MEFLKSLLFNVLPTPKPSGAQWRHGFPSARPWAIHLTVHVNGFKYKVKKKKKKEPNKFYVSFNSNMLHGTGVIYVYACDSTKQLLVDNP